MIGSRIPAKERSVKAIFKGSLEEKREEREKLRRFFQYSHVFDVIVEYMGEKKYCRGRLYAYSLPTVNIYKDLEINFTILCTQPLLLSFDDFARNIAEIGEGLAFNFEIPETGVNFGTFTFAREIYIDNQGDTETYCRAVIEAFGDVTNPKLFNKDKYIRVLDTLHNGDVLEIDLVSEPISIKKNGVNCIGKVDRTSSFNDMTIQLGENIIGYTADNGDTNLACTVYYNERYLGL